jgi:hypothetical protein
VCKRRLGSNPGTGAFFILRGLVVVRRIGGLVIAAALGVLLACVGGGAVREADATMCLVPDVFVNGVTIIAAPFNADFSSLQTCGNNIDNGNIGSAGLFASNLLPTNVTQATFGGSSLYTFPAGVAAGGPRSATTGTFSGALGGTTGTFSGVVTANNLTSLGGFPTGGASQSGFSWNYSGGQGEVDIATGYNPGAQTVNFYRWSGAAYVLASSIGNSGVYNVGSSSYGPTSATVNGGVSATTGTYSGALSAVGLSSSAGVAVGGALTGATTGGFSGAITGGGYSGGAVSGTTLSPTAGTLTAIGWGSCATSPNCTIGLNVTMPNTSYRCQLTVNSGSAGPGTVFAYSIVNTSQISVWGPSTYTVQGFCYE